MRSKGNGGGGLGIMLVTLVLEFSWVLKLIKKGFYYNII